MVGLNLMVLRWLSTSIRTVQGMGKEVEVAVADQGAVWVLGIHLFDQI